MSDSSINASAAELSTCGRCDRLVGDVERHQRQGVVITFKNQRTGTAFKFVACRDETFGNIRLRLRDQFTALADHQRLTVDGRDILDEETPTRPPLPPRRFVRIWFAA